MDRHPRRNCCSGVLPFGHLIQPTSHPCSNPGNIQHSPLDSAPATHQCFVLRHLLRQIVREFSEYGGDYRPIVTPVKASGHRRPCPCLDPSHGVDDGRPADRLRPSAGFEGV
ncbi:MAG: hypothetical protein M3361_06825 [Candidatus Tectomicrobia bacterium]|nr:hypothetical protein [Candidatus Tectomicrobia bacterium]